MLCVTYESSMLSVIMLSVVAPYIFLSPIKIVWNSRTFHRQLYIIVEFNIETPSDNKIEVLFWR